MTDPSGDTTPTPPLEYQRDHATSGLRIEWGGGAAGEVTIVVPPRPFRAEVPGLVGLALLFALLAWATVVASQHAFGSPAGGWYEWFRSIVCLSGSWCVWALVLALTLPSWRQRHIIQVTGGRLCVTAAGPLRTRRGDCEVASIKDVRPVVGPRLWYLKRQTHLSVDFFDGTSATLLEDHDVAEIEHVARVLREALGGGPAPASDSPSDAPR